MKIKGVCEVIEYSDEYEVIIENKDVINEVFNFIKGKKNITKFVVEEPSLNEIFVAKVGESFEK